MTTPHYRHQASGRRLCVAAFLFVFCVSANAFADDDVTTSAQLSIRELDASRFVRPQKAEMLRRATGAAFRAVHSGLVLFDVAVKGADSCLYVKFGSDGMPRLRWRTRF